MVSILIWHNDCQCAKSGVYCLFRPTGQHLKHINVDKMLSNSVDSKEAVLDRLRFTASLCANFNHVFMDVLLLCFTFWQIRSEFGLLRFVYNLSYNSCSCKHRGIFLLNSASGCKTEAAGKWKSLDWMMWTLSCIYFKTFKVSNYCFFFLKFCFSWCIFVFLLSPWIRSDCVLKVMYCLWMETW